MFRISEFSLKDGLIFYKAIYIEKVLRLCVLITSVFKYMGQIVKIYFGRHCFLLNVFQMISHPTLNQAEISLYKNPFQSSVRKSFLAKRQALVR